MFTTNLSLASCFLFAFFCFQNDLAYIMIFLFIFIILMTYAHVVGDYGLVASFLLLLLLLLLIMLKHLLFIFSQSISCKLWQRSYWWLQCSLKVSVGAMARSLCGPLWNVFLMPLLKGPVYFCDHWLLKIWPYFFLTCIFLFNSVKFLLCTLHCLLLYCFLLHSCRIWCDSQTYL